MPFEFGSLEIPDVVLVEPKSFEDDRGFFLETYKKSAFEEAGIKKQFVQDNHSYSKERVLRGLHYQLTPKAQAKLIRCVKGEIYDVAVDIRKNSPHYGDWIGVYLNEENHKMFYLPEGFAHGFLVTKGEAHVLYKASNEYAPGFEAGIAWDDSTISIDWPLEETPIISEKDANLPSLEVAKNNFKYRKD